MAARKDKIKEAMEEFVADLLEDGEAWQGGSLAQSGPMPGLFGVIGMAFIKQYYVALTDRRVLFVRSAQLSGRPLRLEFENPRDSAQMVLDVQGKFWNLATYRGSKTIRLRYPKLWVEEMAIVIHALRGSA